MIKNGSHMNKIEGVFIIVNSMMPFILVLLLTLATWMTWQNMKASVEAYTYSLGNIIHSAQVAKQQIQQTALKIADSAIRIKHQGENISQQVTAVVTRFDKTVEHFGDNFANAVRDLPVVGNALIKPMKMIGNKIAQPLKPLGKSFSRLGNSVGTIKTEISQITGNLDQLRNMEAYLDKVIIEYRLIINNINNIMSAIAKLLSWLAIGTAVIITWFAFSYLLWVRQRLITGFRLLTAS